MARPSIAKTLDDFQSTIDRCSDLVIRADEFCRPSGQAIFERDREEIISSAFLKMGLAWESFLEESFVKFLCGATKITGGAVTLNQPAFNTMQTAKSQILGSQAYVNWSAQNTKTRAANYFAAGEPFDSAISGIASDLTSFTAIRNRIAHRSDHCRNRFRNEVTQRIGFVPRGVTPGRYLRMDFAPNLSGFEHFKRKFLATATIIAQ